MCSIIRVPSRSILHYAPEPPEWQNWGMDIRDRIIMLIEKDPELSVRNVSLAAGLSDSALSKFLKGSIRSLTLETVDKLAEALGVDPEWLAYGVGDPERASSIDKLFKQVPEDQREQARRILETFTRTGTDG